MQQEEQKSKNQKAVIIVLVIVLVVAILLILGIGGYFAYKYYSGKSAKSTPTSTPISTSLNMSQRMHQMLDTLDYPNSTMVKQGEAIDENRIIERNMKTSDNTVKIYNYYMRLAENNKWGLGRSGMSTDRKQAFLTLTGDGFNVDLNMDSKTDKNKTVIELDLQIGDDLKNNGDFDYDYYDDSSTSTDSGKKQVTTNYIILDSNSRVISESELYNLTPWELKVARNEIYARHGRPFVHKDLQCYFATKSWYSEDSNFSESSLSTTEVKNISIILDYEKETNSPMLGKDSGC